MDWDLDKLRELTINCTFHKRGRKVFKATMHAGLTGVFTGLRYCNEENPEGNLAAYLANVLCTEYGLPVPPAEGYSIALNYRKTGGALSLSYNLLQIINGGWGIGYFISMGLTRDRETHKYLISNHFAQDMRWKLRQRTRKPSSFYPAAH